MSKRAAWLVVVDRTGECRDGFSSRDMMRESARELAESLEEPLSVLRVEYEWEPDHA